MIKSLTRAAEHEVLEFTDCQGNEKNGLITVPHNIIRPCHLVFYHLRRTSLSVYSANLCTSCALNKHLNEKILLDWLVDS